MNQDKYDEAYQLSKTKLVVIDFHAVWCGPCRNIEPEVKKLAEEYADELLVYKCDVDDCSEVSSEANVTCMPTFHFVKNGEKVAELLGANKDKLKELIVTHK